MSPPVESAASRGGLGVLFNSYAFLFAFLPVTWVVFRAAAARGRTAEGHEHRAEHYYLLGDLEAAVLQLEIALRDKTIGFYDSSRLESRLQQVRDELAETKRRERERG